MALFIPSMNYTLQITIVALVVTTMALAPSLIMNQSAEAASHVKCEDEKGKSHTWISGCKDGGEYWKDVCGLGPTEGDKGQYAEGYIAA